MLLFLTALTATVCSCNTNNRRGEIEKIVAEWLGKEILLPQGLPCFVAGSEAQPENCDQWLHRDFKILMYVDSAGCSDCRLNLSSWKYLIEEADSLFDGQVGFLLYFQPKSKREIAYLLARDRFEYPVFMDINGVIDRQNRFSSDMRFQCFLLDRDNRVLMIGNPVLNADIWELYKTQVSNLINRKLTELQILFKIDTKIASVDFENFAHQGSISTLYALNRIARGRATEAVSLLEFVVCFPEMAREILQTASFDSYIAPLAIIVTGSTPKPSKDIDNF